MRELVRLDEAWVPRAESGALYVRPVLFSSDPSIRVKPAERYLFVSSLVPSALFAAPGEALVATVCGCLPGRHRDTRPAGTMLRDSQRTRKLASSDANRSLARRIERRYGRNGGVINVFFVAARRIVTPELPARSFLA